MRDWESVVNTTANAGIHCTYLRYGKNNCPLCCNFVVDNNIYVWGIRTRIHTSKNSTGEEFVTMIPQQWGLTPSSYKQPETNYGK
ncbi:hypothetical protein TNCV_97291 [Trichonephila clavipes]|nr:hypothetical protein TNCV_97291 [Trichonephila clavipes]